VHVPSRAAGTSAPPAVSLLIPVHNGLEFTRACLASLFAHADPDIATEILVIDDCSDDGTDAYLRSLGDAIRFVRNDSRGCFGHNINRAAPAAQGEFLLLLNNDTVVTLGWLGHMLSAALRDPLIGVVGNCQLYPGTRTINHAGMAFDAQRHPVHLYAHRPADFSPARVSREFQSVTGACWLVRRTLFLELDGFDPHFRNGWEDVDFCLRVRERGYKVWYAADSVIYHHLGASAGRFDCEAANERYFADKWHGRIVPDLNDYLARDGQLPPPARWRVTAPRLLAKLVRPWR
jgi:GT2 family glycosyltransferase